MAKYKTYSMEEKEKLCALGKALASPERLLILELLNEKDMIIADIAKELNLPVSSTAFHLRQLEQAELICMEPMPHTRGNVKLCKSLADHASIELFHKNTDINECFTAEMPVGAYSSCRVTPPCGLFDRNGMIGTKDAEHVFYYPQRLNAGMVWSSSGYLEYKFANGVPRHQQPKKLSISMELCSEAPGYREDYKSDITLWINGCDCGTWTSPGDFGSRRGRLNPPSLKNGRTQYGMQVLWEVSAAGCFVNGEKAGTTAIRQLCLSDQSYIAVRVGNKPNALHLGGFNLFGKGFGDYDQDILLTVEYGG